MDLIQSYSHLNLSPQSAAAQEITAEMHRLAMVLIMRTRQKARQYVYLPSHVFSGQLCMVLQTNYFRLDQRHQIVEISQDEAFRIMTTDLDSVIIAREIAFGPVADASVRPVSTYFNINSDDIERCTRAQARRHKRTRHRIRAKRNLEKQTDDAIGQISFSLPPFICHQPVDDAAFDLITGIQTHRYRLLKYYLTFKPRHRELQSLAEEEERLQISFISQRRFWSTWTWPKRIGSSDIDDSTEVPAVDGTYNFITYGDPGYGEDSLFFGIDHHDDDTKNTDLQLLVSNQATLATGFIWKSFVVNLQLLSDQMSIDLTKKDQMMPTHDPIVPFIHRIPALRDLSMKQPANRHTSR